MFLLIGISGIISVLFHGSSAYIVSSMFTYNVSVSWIQSDGSGHGFLVIHSVMINLTVGVAASTLDFGDSALGFCRHVGCSVEAFFKDRFWVKCLEFGAKVSQTLGAAVRTTPSVGELVVVILHLIARATPRRRALEG